MEESVAQGSWAVHWRGESECRRSCKEGLIQSTSNAMLLLSAGYPRTAKFNSAMSQPDQKSLLAKRAAQKRAARQEDLARLEGGMSPESLQRENSIFPKSFFENARISNLKQAVGR